MHVAKGLKPVQPPAHVWSAIRQRLNLSADRSPRRWARSWALAASIVLVAGLAGLLYWRSLPSVRATATSTIAAKSGDEMWQVQVFGTTNRLVVHAAKLSARPAGRDYELWALPKGGNPVSLGVLPIEGTSTRALTAIQKAALASSSQVAVSIEPPGGSPTGQPTGDIVFVAAHPVSKEILKMQARGNRHQCKNRRRPRRVSPHEESWLPPSDAAPCTTR
jgi:anti-sigma-K factor RskA